MYQIWATVDGEENYVLGEGVAALEAVADGRANAHRLLETGHTVDLTTPARIWRVRDHKPIPGEWVLLNPPTDGQPVLHHGFNRGLSSQKTKPVVDAVTR